MNNFEKAAREAAIIGIIEELHLQLVKNEIKWQKGIYCIDEKNELNKEIKAAAVGLIMKME